jgi:hypothetical protein
MITFKELMRKLNEDAPANSVGLPSGISPPAQPNATATNVNTKKPKLLNRKMLPVGAERHSPL